jgi:hypothetical protein
MLVHAKKTVNIKLLKWTAKKIVKWLIAQSRQQNNFLNIWHKKTEQTTRFLYSKS